MRLSVAWVPAAILGFGCLLVQAVHPQQRMALVQPLEQAVPAVLDGFEAMDVEISEEEQRVAGMDDYLMRAYQNGEGAGFTVYVGYYESQLEGNGIHSPKNCLPGAGWEALSATTTSIVVGGTAVAVNQYVVRREQQSALVLYWYQGRGRVAASEITSAWRLWRDAAFHGRTEEALVRIVVPITPDANANDLGHRIAAAVIPMVDEALPGLH
jgi:EpsI family protein